MRGYLGVVRRWWPLILAASLTAGVAGYFVARQLDPAFEASTRLLVGPISSNNVDEIRAAGQLAVTYAELISGDDVLQAAIRDVPLPMALEDLRQSVSARGNGTTRILTITVSLADSSLAAATANRLAGALVALTAAAPESPGEVRVINPAEIPERPVAPQIPLITALAGLAGLVTAGFLALFADYFSGRVRGRSDVEALEDAPLLGIVPVRNRAAKSVRQGLGHPAGEPLAAPYHGLSASIFATSSGAVRSLLVVGTEAGDGTAEVALNIARGAAENGHLTAVIDSTPHDVDVDVHPSGPPGLGNLQVLTNRAEAATGFHMPDPEPGAGPSEQLLVVSSAGPQDASATALWAARCDATVVVVLRDITGRQELADTVNGLRRMGANVIGVVFAHMQPGVRSRRTVDGTPRDTSA